MSVNLNITNINNNASTITNLNTSNTSITNLYTSNMTMSNLNTNIATITNLNTTNSTMTSLYVSNITNSTSLSINSNTLINNTSPSTSVSSGALVLNGGLGIAGTVNWNRPYGYITGNATQSIPSTTDVLLNTYWNTSLVTANGMTYNSGLFKVPITGLYLVTGSASTVTAIPFLIYTVVNGSITNRRGQNVSGSTSVACSAVNTVTLLNVNDTISMYVYQSSGSTLSTNNGGYDIGYFSIIML